MNFSDDFNQPDGPLNSTNWALSGFGGSVVSDRVEGGFETLYIVKFPCSSTDQFSEITQLNKTGDVWGPQICLPSETAGPANGYRILTADWMDEVSLMKEGVSVGQVNLGLSSIPVPYVWRLEKLDDTVKLFFNGAEVFSFDDVTPLVGEYVGFASASPGGLYDNYSGGDLGGGVIVDEGLADDELFWFIRSGG